MTNPAQFHIESDANNTLVRRGTSAQLAKSIATALQGMGVEPPADIAKNYEFNENAAYNNLIRTNPDALHDHVRNAAEAVLNGEDPKPHLLNYSAWQFTRGLAQKIVEVSAEQSTAAINNDADSIIQQVRAEIVAPIISKLEALQEKHPNATWDIRIAVDKADYEQASIIRDNAHLVEPLESAYHLRAMLYNKSAFTSPAAWFTNPGTGAGTPQPGKFQWWMDQIRAGRKMHYPTASEWHELDQKLYAKTRQQDTARAAATKPKEVAISKRKSR